MKRQYKKEKLALTIGTAILATSATVSAYQVNQINVLYQNSNGVPTFVTGELGITTKSNASQPKYF